MSGRRGMSYYSKEIKEAIQSKIASGKSQNQIGEEYKIRCYTI